MDGPDFKVELKNIGRSPAQRVSFDTRLVPINGGHPETVVRELKKTAADRPEDRVGIVLFPDQKVEDQPNFHSILFEPLQYADATEVNRISFYLVCLATYRMNTSSEPRYTGSTYLLEHRDESGGTRDFEVTVASEFTDEEVSVTSYGPGSFAT